MVGNEPFIDFKEKIYEGSIQKIKDELESVSINFSERAIFIHFLLCVDLFFSTEIIVFTYIAMPLVMFSN